MAGGGAALAVKPAPQITGADAATCTGSDDDTGYYTSVHLDGKGRWGFVTVTLNLSSGPVNAHVDPPLKVRLSPERYIEAIAPGAPKSATMTLTVTDRKGVPVVPVKSVTTPPFCD